MDEFITIIDGTAPTRKGGRGRKRLDKTMSDKPEEVKQKQATEPEYFTYGEPSQSDPIVA